MLKWNHQFEFTTGSQTPGLVITVTTIMSGTPKNELNKIREKVERDNKEVHAHDGMDLEDFLLRAKNRLGSWYERAKRTTNSASINSLDKNTCERFEIWATTTQTMLNFCHQLAAITGPWTREPITTAFIGMPRTAKNNLNNVQEEFNAAWTARKVSHMCFAEHMMMIRDRYQWTSIFSKYLFSATIRHFTGFYAKTYWTSRLALCRGLSCQLTKCIQKIAIIWWVLKFLICISTLK